MKNTRNFTLIELLTVIGIIAILMAIFFPVLLGIQERGRITETKTLLSAIRAAIYGYKGEYGIVPPGAKDNENPVGGGWAGNINSMNPGTEYFRFFDILTYSNHNNAKGLPEQNVQDGNPRAIHFLSTSKSYFSKSRNHNSIRDSWNRPLAVFLDRNGSGKIEPDKKYDPSDGAYIDDAVIISMGPQNTESFSNVKKNSFIFSCK